MDSVHKRVAFFVDGVYIVGMGIVTSSPTPRATYRHGDLRRALIEAGLELARDGGPDAVVLREATRRAGVVPNAAYRHFASRDELLHEVRAAALAAVGTAMQRELTAIHATSAPAEAARAQLRAVGVGYLRFAAAERGLFRTAFSRPTADPQPSPPGTIGPRDLNPFVLLGTALDALVAAGLLPSERRPGAEYLAWSAVHGLAMLLIDGPLAGLSEARRQEVGDRVIAMVENGL